MTADNLLDNLPLNAGLARAYAADPARVAVAWRPAPGRCGADRHVEESPLSGTQASAPLV
jgi:hypothetical protein